MEQLFSNFGVKPILLAAQIVNFLILFLILKKLLYGPLLQILEDRKNKIKESLLQAEKIENQYQQVNAESEKKLAEARNNAKKIIDAASSSANDIILKAQQQAQVEIDLMKQKAMENLLQDWEREKQVMQKEYAQTVILGIEKITSSILNLNEHKALIESQLKQLESQELFSDSTDSK